MCLQPVWDLFLGCTMSLQPVWDLFLGRTMSLQPVWDLFLGRTMCLQPVWDWVSEHSVPLASPFFPVLFSLGVYLAFCLPFTCLDLLSSRVALIRSYRIQPHSSVTWDTMRSCLSLSLYNHAVFIFPVTVLHWCWRPVAVQGVSSAPSVLSLLGGMLACLLLFDFQYFIWHVLHHKVPWLYRTFHKVHHTHTAPSALTAQYSGAWEMLSLGLFAAVNPFLLGLHPLTELAFFTLNIWLAVEDHCGYDLPWATHRLVPGGLYGGAPHHHLHHLKSRSNYAPYFTHWDRLAGTLLRHGD